MSFRDDICDSRAGGGVGVGVGSDRDVEARSGCGDSYIIGDLLFVQTLLYVYLTHGPGSVATLDPSSSPSRRDITMKLLPRNSGRVLLSRT